MSTLQRKNTMSNTNKIKLEVAIDPVEGVMVVYNDKAILPEMRELQNQLKAAGLTSSTPGGRWRQDKEYAYTTLVYKPTKNSVGALANEVKAIINKNKNFTLKNTQPFSDSLQTVTVAVDTVTVDDLAGSRSPYNFDHIEITVSTDTAPTNVRKQLLATLNAAGIKSITPGGRWLVDPEYNYASLICKPSGDLSAYAKTIEAALSELPWVSIERTALTESINYETVDAIDSLLKDMFVAPTGISVNDSNIVFDSHVDVEANEINIYIYATEIANANDKALIKDITKLLIDTLKSRSDVDKVTKVSDENATVKLTVKLADSGAPLVAPDVSKQELKTERLATLTRRSLNRMLLEFDRDVADVADDGGDGGDVADEIEDIVDGNTIAIWPAKLDESDQFAIVITNPENDELLTHALDEARKLLYSDEDDNETLLGDINQDGVVVIRAPEDVTESTVHEWVNSIVNVFEHIGFDVTLNMSDDSSTDDFERITDPATVLTNT